MAFRLFEKRAASPPKLIAAIFCLLMTLLATPDTAPAHRVYLYAWVEGDTIHTESYFSSNRKVQNARIAVYDLSADELLVGRTDADGRFAFPAPQKKGLRIVVETGTGHKGEYLLKLDKEGVSAAKGGVPPAANAGSPALTPAAQGCLDREQIRAVVEKALDERLGPLSRELARRRGSGKPGFKEIFAGIGYICGIMGLLLYLRNRKQKG
jgi:nickel transport protein